MRRAKLYGVQCEAKRLENAGARRAILRVILGPVIEGLELEDLDRMRNEAVEAMMVLMFKPLDEVQDMLAAWAKQAVKDGRYQARVYAWTGIPMEMEMANEIDETESTVHIEGPIVDEAVISSVTERCTPGLEIVLTFLTMLGPVTEKSVGATGVLFDAVLGYSEATRKFDKATVEMVPGVSEQLCSLARLYGIRCEPRMLHTPPGARAILREMIGPIIEEHSPAVLEDIRDEAGEIIRMITCRPLEEVETIISTWAAAAAKQDGRYQTRVFAWTGRRVDDFSRHATGTDQLQATAMERIQLRRGVGDDSKTGNHKNGDDAASDGSAEAPMYLEIATCNTVVELVTVQALFAMDILPKREATFTTMFPTPLDVCLGRVSVLPAPFSDYIGGYVVDEISTAGSAYDEDEMENAKELMDASDEEDYHRIVGFQFPACPSPVPELDPSNESTPTTNVGSPSTTWSPMEMTACKAELHSSTEKEAKSETQKAMFEPHAAAWEDEQLSNWLIALKADGRDEEPPGMGTCIANDQGAGMESLKDTKTVNSDIGMCLLKAVGRFFGFV
ncbi:unnamed protein product [Rhizoctonia solani]|uniref:Uncharacterized protein n=1 Tax=Rhizoctonia solani TaxID=456999 RepID=A0A8H3B025_9AGAM|nr:unnamed protein product [Rhizoctonia solani]